MPLAFDSLAALTAHGFDTVIDVRSPAEFAEDHIPGAINLPALSDAERAEVGTIYKQVSPFDARKIGAALVARNVAAHLQGPLADKAGGWRPLLYCWRGGQRSGSFASILTQIGWRADIVAGGYRSYRRLVQAALYDSPPPHPLVLLDGDTGTAKTAILARLARRGVQVIDLEGLARHRGSLLGGAPADQPSQKAFESGLAVALATSDPARLVVVEAESNKIGRLNLPPGLWQAMAAAPRLVIEAPAAARAAYLARAYADLAADAETLRARLKPLRHLRGHAVVDRWEQLLAAGDMQALALALMQDHYDPAYAKGRHAFDRQIIATLTADALDHPALDTLADRAVVALRASGHAV